MAESDCFPDLRDEGATLKRLLEPSAGRPETLFGPALGLGLRIGSFTLKASSES